MAAAKKTIKKVAPKPKKEFSTAPVAVYSMAGKEVATAAFPESVFGRAWKPDLVHQVTTAIAANKRQNRAHTKDRAEVKGGGRKPWKQKGTGQARHGSTRSPLWRHGGVTFGPRKERDYHEKINKKMRTAALLSVLSRKAADGEIILVDSFAMGAPKTAEALKALGALAKATKTTLATKRTNAALIALASYEESAIKSFRNIRSIKTEEVRNLNPLDLLTYKYLVIEAPEKSFAALMARTK